MKILKFNESQNSDQLLSSLFDEAVQEFEEVRDYFLELEDSKTFSYGFNYCAYYPETEEFIISLFLCDGLSKIEESFSDSAIDDILGGQANLSFMIGIGCVPEDLPNAKVDSFEGEEIEEDSKQGYVSYNQTHLSNFIKLSQVLKQADMRMNKQDYDLKFQFDNYGATILIGRRNLNN